MIVFELQYFPPITFFNALYKESYVYLDLYESYRKMSFRNRCLVAGAGGIISLSVPLQHGRSQQLPMKDVLISEIENWQIRHFKSLESAYNRSPFFEYYRDELSELFNKKFKFLTDWNLTCMDWLNSKLDWPAEIRFTDEAISFGSVDVDDRRHKVIPQNYSLFRTVEYRQVFAERTGFYPNLSILDLLFNTGSESGDLLRNAGMAIL